MDALQAAQAHIAGTPGVTNEAAAAFALGYAAALSGGGGSDSATGDGDEDAKEAMAIAAREQLKARRPLRSRSYDSESGSPSVYRYDLPSAFF